MSTSSCHWLSWCWTPWRPASASLLTLSLNISISCIRCVWFDLVRIMLSDCKWSSMLRCYSSLLYVTDMILVVITGLTMTNWCVDCTGLCSRAEGKTLYQAHLIVWRYELDWLALCLGVVKLRCHSLLSVCDRCRFVYWVLCARRNRPTFHRRRHTTAIHNQWVLIYLAWSRYFTSDTTA